LSLCDTGCFFGCELLVCHWTKFFQASCFASQAAQIVELLATYASVTDNFYFVDAGRVNQEGTLDSNAIGNTAHREIAIDAATAQAHHNALKWLQTLTTAFNNFYLQAYRVARLNFWNIIFKMSTFDSGYERPPCRPGYDLFVGHPIFLLVRSVLDAGNRDLAEQWARETT
jgi:hypothetical protein